MAGLLLEPGDHGVVALVGPSDVDPGEGPAGYDDADAEQDAEGDVAGDLRPEEVAPEGDQEDEAVVDGEGDPGELNRELVLALDEILELGVFQEMEIPSGFAHRGGILPFGEGFGIKNQAGRAASPSFRRAGRGQGGGRRVSSGPGAQGITLPGTPVHAERVRPGVVAWA